MIKVYGIKNCNKIRDTINWLEDQKIDYEFIDLKKRPLSGKELESFVHKVGLDVLVNRKGMKWRQLGLANQDLDDEELFDKLLENQTMIRRPLMTNEQAVLVGYDEDAFKNFVD